MPLKDPEARHADNVRRYRENRDEIRKHNTEKYQNDPAFAEAARQRSRKRYAAKKEQIAEWGRKYRAEHKEEKAARDKAWKQANPERVRASNRKSAKRRRDHINQWRRKYRVANRAKISQANAAYYERTKDKRQAYSRKWWKENPLMARMYAHERRAREAMVGGRHAAEDAHRLWLHYGKKCAVYGCKHAIEEGGKQFGYCVDHVMPLSRGGTNDFTNLQILCKPHNSQKSNRTNEEWIALFDIRLRKVPLLVAVI